MSGKFALIIGNTEYVDPGLAKLTAPGNDAQDFARVLKDPDICGFDDVKVLLNQRSSTVSEAIDEFFDEKKPDDMLVLYFSGHGIRDELGTLYLAVKNTIRSRLRSTAVKSDYIREVMDQSRTKRQILILDCCNSGAFEQGTKAATGVSIGTAAAFQGGYGRIVLTASDANQYAWEGDKVIGETDNSLFTHYLVEGLEGEADRDGDGCITVDELYDYAYEKVKLATPKQTPSKFSSKQQGEIILRNFLRMEDIKPATLPEEVLQAIGDSRTFVREGAVQQLGKLLNGKHLGLARAAREALERIQKDDDSRQVSRAASEILEASSDQEILDTQRRKAVVRNLPGGPTRTSQAGLNPIRPEKQVGSPNESVGSVGVSGASSQHQNTARDQRIPVTAPPTLQPVQNGAAVRANSEARISLILGATSLIVSLCNGYVSLLPALVTIYFGFRGLSSSRKMEALGGLAFAGASIVVSTLYAVLGIYLLTAPSSYSYP